MNATAILNRSPLLLGRLSFILTAILFISIFPTKGRAQINWKDQKNWKVQKAPGDEYYHERRFDALGAVLDQLSRSISDNLVTRGADNAKIETLISLLTERIKKVEDQLGGLPKEPSPNRVSAHVPDIGAIMQSISDLRKELETKVPPQSPPLQAITDLKKEIEALRIEIEKSGESGSAAATVLDAPTVKADEEITLGELASLKSISGADIAKIQISINITWTLMAGFLIMIMQAGFALVETGFVGKKNAVHTMAMNFMVYSLAMLGYWVCGFAIHMGGIGADIADKTKDIHQLGPIVYETLNKEWSPFGMDIIGWKGLFLCDPAMLDGSILTLFLFNMLFMDTAATIPTGSMAERWRFGHFCFYGFAVGAFIYPVYANWVWGGGWLADLGMTMGWGHGVVDFAGSSVVHLCGGTMAYVGARKLKERDGRYDADGRPKSMPKHNLTLGVLGTFILAFGWFGFNAGSTLAARAHIGVIATNTMLASASGAVTMLVLTYRILGRPNILFMCNGMLGGLVAITAPCAFVDPVAAVMIGAIAALVVLTSAEIIEDKWVTRRIDDPIGAVSVHGACGLWGMLAVGIFANGKFGKDWNGVGGYVKGVIVGDWSQLWAQMVGIAACIGIIWALTTLAFKLIGLIAGDPRADENQQNQGLDMAEFGTIAYDERTDTKP